jgi:hypothetical protein
MQHNTEQKHVDGGQAKYGENWAKIVQNEEIRSNSPRIRPIASNQSIKSIGLDHKRSATALVRGHTVLSSVYLFFPVDNGDVVGQ